MALAMLGCRVPLARLSREANTRPRIGTRRRDLAKTAGSYGFRAGSKCGSSLAELRRLVRRRAAVIIEYILPGEECAHYAVVSGFSPGRILLHDPTAGPYYALKRREFLKRWYGWHRTVHRNWRLAISADR